MSLALGLDYWVLPQIRSFYTLDYKLTDDGLDALERLLKHVLRRKGLARLFGEHDEF